MKRQLLTMLISMAVFGIGPTLATAAETQYGPVKLNENISTIAASQQREQGADMVQWIVAIHQANPDAFIKGNVNLLKSGAMLDLPALTEVEAVNLREAKKTLVIHNLLLGTRTDLPPAKLGASADTQTLNQRNAELEGRIPALNQQIAALQKEIETQQQLLRDLKSQTSELGKQIAQTKAENDTLRRDQSTQKPAAPAESNEPALRKRIQELEGQLAEAKARITDLETRLQAEKAKPKAAPGNPVRETQLEAEVVTHKADLDKARGQAKQLEEQLKAKK